MGFIEEKLAFLINRYNEVKNRLLALDSKAFTAFAPHRLPPAQRCADIFSELTRAHETFNGAVKCSLVLYASHAKAEHVTLFCFEGYFLLHFRDTTIFDTINLGASYKAMSSDRRVREHLRDPDSSFTLATFEAQDELDEVLRKVEEFLDALDGDGNV